MVISFWTGISLYSSVYISANKVFKQTMKSLKILPNRSQLTFLSESRSFSDKPLLPVIPVLHTPGQLVSMDEMTDRIRFSQQRQWVPFQLSSTGCYTSYKVNLQIFCISGSCGESLLNTVICYLCGI